MSAEQAQRQSAQKLTCLCSPTTHAGSFRCRFHRASDNHWLASHSPASAPQPQSFSKPSAKPFCESDGAEKPSNDYSKSFDIPKIPKVPMICKPVSESIPRPNRIPQSNMVSSIGGNKKPYGKVATSSFGGKIETVNNQARYSKQSQLVRSREASFFAVGKCQNTLRNMQSEIPRPIFSS